MKRILWLILAVFIIAIVIVIILLNQQKASETISSEDQIKLTNFDQQVIYTQTAEDNTSIFSLDLGTKNSTALITGLGLKGLPVMSEDLAKLAYWQKSEDSYLIKLLSLPEKTIKAISIAQSEPSFLALAPDNTKLIYLQPTASWQSSGQTLFINLLASQETYEIANNVIDASWSVDNKKIIFTQALGSEQKDFWVIIQELDDQGQLTEKEQFYQGAAKPFFYNADSYVVMLGQTDGREQIFTRSLAAGSPVDLVTNFEPESEYELNDIALSPQRTKLIFEYNSIDEESHWLIHLNSQRLQKLNLSAKFAFWGQSDDEVLILDDQDQLVKISLSTNQQEIITALSQADNLVANYLGGNKQPKATAEVLATVEEANVFKELLPAGDEYLSHKSVVVRVASRADTLVASKILGTDRYRLTIFDSNHKRIYSNDQILVLPDRISSKSYGDDSHKSFYLFFSTDLSDNYYVRWQEDHFDIFSPPENE